MPVQGRASELLCLALGRAGLLPWQPWEPWVVDGDCKPLSDSNPFSVNLLAFETPWLFPSDLDFITDLDFQKKGSYGSIRYQWCGLLKGSLLEIYSVLSYWHHWLYFSVLVPADENTPLLAFILWFSWSSPRLCFKSQTMKGCVGIEVVHCELVEEKFQLLTLSVWRGKKRTLQLYFKSTKCKFSLLRSCSIIFKMALSQEGNMWWKIKCIFWGSF